MDENEVMTLSEVSLLREPSFVNKLKICNTSEEVIGKFVEQKSR